MGITRIDESAFPYGYIDAIDFDVDKSYIGQSSMRLKRIFGWDRNTPWACRKLHQFNPS